MTFYQTLEDRGFADTVERDGPFLCREKGAWLGRGYYFWDEDIKLAHWWGMQTTNGAYIICEAKAKKDRTLWDLLDPIHVKEFRLLVHEIIELKVATEDEVIVSSVINFFREKGKFPYTAIRAIAHNSFGNEFYRWVGNNAVKFHSKRNAYLDLHPLVQVCLMEKTALSLHNFCVVYPSHLVEDILG